MFATKVVKGMPFSAKVITESNQPLVDDNRISLTSVASIVRDSEGRTRRDHTLPQVGTESAATASIVFIQDPASESAYVLEPQSRLARRWSILYANAARQPAEIHAATGNAESNMKIESLGTQVVEGILAEGTRIIRTLLAVEAGNERPLDIVSET